jgi:DNA-binding NarL/FixJ family response regulator
MVERIQMSTETIELGPSGYVFKSDAETYLAPALEAVLNGKQFFSGRD